MNNSSNMGLKTTATSGSRWDTKAMLMHTKGKRCTKLLVPASIAFGVWSGVQAVLSLTADTSCFPYCIKIFVAGQQAPRLAGARGL